MAQGDKSAYYRALKEAGYTFQQHYRDYTTEQLKALWQDFTTRNGLDQQVETPEPKDAPPPREDELAQLRAQMASVVDTVQALAEMVTSEDRRAERTPVQRSPEVPHQRAALDPNEHAGITLNTPAEDGVIEVDEHGNRWYQKEVAKPAFPKPRGRRVLRYDDPGVTTEKIRVGEYVEEFEVSGDPTNARPAEIKITLPSYQTGIYKPPNMPFRVHTYNGARGFNLFDVQAYYGGSDLVPPEVKRCYVSTDLCYDITTTIRTIENEYRERVLKAGKGL